MDENREYQPELFSEFPKGRIKKAKAFKSMPKLKNITISISREKLVSLVIAVILLYVIIFSLGVEKGKSMSLSVTDKASGSAAAAKAEAVKKENSREVIIKRVKDRQIESKAAKDEQKEQIAAGAIKDKKPPAYKSYSLQLAAYAQLSRAEKEAEKLKKRGYTVFIDSNSKYHIVFVGNYRDKEKAQKLKKKLSKEYKGCYVKSRLIQN
ncbi:MAG: SPOR domain-containing protein [Candidatus Omnitrophica bacterium]|nr:SPOR domain-containing protein [Candidatus Omnitrophota bacterium]